MRLFSRRQEGNVPRFQRLVIEPSGLSDPAPIAQAILLNPVMSRVMRLEAIITTVDSLFAEMQLAAHPETRKQVALADRLVLTKTEVVTAAGIERLRIDLRDHNPAAPILSAFHGTIDVALVFPPAFFVQDLSPPVHHRLGLFAESVGADHLGRHQMISLTADRSLGWHSFDRWLRQTGLATLIACCGSKAGWTLTGWKVRSWSKASITF